MVFLVIEIARVMYVWNTAQDITRQAARAAAGTDFSNAAHMLLLQQQALPPGAALLGGFSANQVRIDYLSVNAAGAMAPVATLAACPTRNLINCTNAPHGANCVRLVRARLCQNDGAAACTPAPYQPLLPLLLGFGGGAMALSIPSSDTVVTAETLGYLPGMASCP